MSDIHHIPVRQALEQLKHLSSDEEAQRLAFVRERALRDEISELKAARREGRLAVLASLLRLKFGELADPLQQRMNQASEAELDLWAERILFAASLEEVFR